MSVSVVHRSGTGGDAEVPLIGSLVEAAGDAKRVLALGRLAVDSAAVLAAEYGVTAVSVEEDPEPAEAVRAASAGTVRVADIAGGDWVGSVGDPFDVVILGDLLERSAHPGRLLDVIRSEKLLRDGGAVVVAVTNAGSWGGVSALLTPGGPSEGILAGDRIRFFTRRSIIDLLNRHGFEMSEMHRLQGGSKAAEGLPPALLRFMGDASDPEVTHFVVRAEPVGSSHELMRLTRGLERSVDERGRLLNQIAAERRTFLDLSAAAGRREERLLEELRRVHRVAETRGNALKKIQRSRAWRIARSFGAVARAARDPSWAWKRLRGKKAEPPARSVRRSRTARRTAARVERAGTLRSAAATAAPRLSIVIPVYNGFEVTRQCLESIFAASIGVSFEVIVVDNASRDGVSPWLEDQRKRRPAMSLIANDVNRGFGPGVNQGAGSASGDYILICNSDVVIPPGALERLVRALDENPDVGIVSPVTNYVGEGPQLDQDASDVTPDSVAEFARRALERDAQLEFAPDRLVFFCVMMRRSLFEVLGGFPEVYGVGNFEDDDLCVRTRMLGYRLAIDRSAFVFHHGSATWEAGRISHKDWMERNRPIYYQRLADLSVTLIRRPRVPVRTPQVSVVVRTVDRPKLLRQALTSLANQTFAGFEVVLINDSGPDLDDLVAEFEPYLSINYVRHPEPRGRSVALNRGLEEAKGRWITYLDDDDIIYPIHLDVLAHSLEETGFRVAYADVNKVLCLVAPDRYAVVAREPFGFFEFDPDQLLLANRLPIQSVVHAAECIPSVGAFDESLDVLEDWDFMIRLSRRFPFFHARRFTSEYRFWVSTATENSIVAKRDDALETHRLIYDRYPVSDESLVKRRLERLENARDQIDKIRVIRGSARSESEKAFDIARLVCGFRLDDR